VSLALVVAGAVGILAGIGPAVQAASVEPTTALRYE
jgi:ABC-type antimicrobial peptide transport system permease subunit